MPRKLYQSADLSVGNLTVKIGRPGYRVTKQYDSETHQRSLLFQVNSTSTIS